MEPDGRSNLLATLVRILSKEAVAIRPGEGFDLLAEANRLIDEDPDFSYLAQNYPKDRGLRPVIGASSNSLDELRAEIERLRIYETYPFQQVRYEILTSGTVATVLWAVLSGFLESEELEERSLVLQVPLVALAFAVGAFFAWGLATASSRTAFYKIVRPDLGESRSWGLFPLAGLLLVILMFATLGFAGISELLYLHGIATTSPEMALDDPLFDSELFYVWSFLNAIPVLEIPQTLRWELDFRFTDHVNPVLLLAYKIAVIAPTIATARLAWAASRSARAEA